ncbi:MAG: hypothetical protein HRU22_18855, partial [Gammaproteobacteria bacterium]|nr:hypothetical protein [Gammaproteobacteria bacterium]
NPYLLAHSQELETFSALPRSYQIKTGFSQAQETDPMGANTGNYHVIRGASWAHGTRTELRLSFRDYGIEPRNDLGFRIARYAQ